MTVGPLLRDWRVRRRLSQLDLALQAGVSAQWLEPPLNVLRVSLHPDGVAPRIVNLGEWRAHLLERLERQIALTGDAALQTLLEELRDYPAADNGHAPSSEVAVPLRLRT